MSRQHRIYLALFEPVPFRFFLTRPLHAWRLWRQRRRTAALLAEICDRLLDDIGLDEIKREAGADADVIRYRFETMR